MFGVGNNYILSKYKCCWHIPHTTVYEQQKERSNSSSYRSTLIAILTSELHCVDAIDVCVCVCVLGVYVCRSFHSPCVLCSGAIQTRKDSGAAAVVCHFQRRKIVNASESTCDHTYIHTVQSSNSISTTRNSEFRFYIVEHE